MMKLVSRLIAGTATAAVTVTMLVASPAAAAPGDATLTFAPTAVLNEGSCIDHAFTYAVELPEGTTSWLLDVRLIGPDNERHGGQLLGTFGGDAPSGSDGLQLCSLFEPIGTYTIVTTTEYKVGTEATVFGAEQIEGTFQAVRNAKSKISLKAKRKGAKVTATAKVAVSTGGTFGPVAAGGKVTFQKKVGKKWKKVARGKTSASGRVKAKFKARKGTVIRAVFAGAGEVLVGSGLPTPPAKSKTVRIR